MPDKWPDFQTLYRPLYKELGLMSLALTKMALSFESVMETYQEFTEWIYLFNKRGIK